jgi:hypothetical protein
MRTFSWQRTTATKHQPRTTSGPVWPCTRFKGGFQVPQRTENVGCRCHRRQSGGFLLEAGCKFGSGAREIVSEDAVRLRCPALQDLVSPAERIAGNTQHPDSCIRVFGGSFRSSFFTAIKYWWKSSSVLPPREMEALVSIAMASQCLTYRKYKNRFHLARKICCTASREQPKRKRSEETESEGGNSRIPISRALVSEICA